MTFDNYKGLIGFDHGADDEVSVWSGGLTTNPSQKTAKITTARFTTLRLTRPPALTRWPLKEPAPAWGDFKYQRQVSRLIPEGNSSVIWLN